MRNPPVAAAAFLLALLSSPSWAGETRHHEAHVHGLARLDVALEGERLSMALAAPGADIVGFEHPAESAEDKAAIDAAVKALNAPDRLFALPAGAGCVARHVDVDAPHQEHDEHNEKEHGHEEHAHEERGHEEHGHEEHGHEEHAEHDEDGHSEFSAEYEFACAKPGALAEIAFPFFETFPNAERIELRVISEKGATAFDIERASPRVDLSGAH